MAKMTEKKLISELKKFKEIKPNSDWVLFTKNQIIGEEKTCVSLGLTQRVGLAWKELLRGEKFVFQHKLAFSSVLMLVILVGMFGFAQQSVPGDSLFTIKKLTEQSQGAFLVDKSAYNFEMAEKRLDDLTKIAQSNSVDNLAPALIEYNETVSKAAKEIAKSGSIEEIAKEVKKLQEKENEIRSYGIEIKENDDLNVALAGLVERELNALKEKELTEEQQELLAEIEKDIENKDYSEALEKILTM